jgi:hypothetical protein
MTRFAYYSPFWIGALIWLGILTAQGDSVFGDPLLLGSVLAAGLTCQLVMIGVQGAFAQVLPVPVGKSIRGRGAVVTGSLILAASVAFATSGLIAMDEVTRAAVVIGVIGAALALCALGAYIWCLPAAARDFDHA